MKVTIEIDCSPEEARRFMGLPDVSALNDEIVGATKKMMTEGALSMITPEAMLKFWTPFGARGMEELQKFMLNSMTGKTDKKN